MDRFAEAYARLGKLDSVLGAAAAHHRLLWIHPFTDGNGRGALSEEALAGFIRFFLDVCLDQVRFMEQLVEPEAFVVRVVRWANAEIVAGRLAARSDRLLESLLARGQVERSDVERLLDVSDRTARRVTSGLIARGVVVSDSPRSPLRLGFPAAIAHDWLPGLFAEAPAARTPRRSTPRAER